MSVNSKPAGAVYWLEQYPLLLVSLADLTPGMKPEDVAELLAEIDEELIKQAEPGECYDFGDGALISIYMNDLINTHK
jgi:hypothetical protein